VELVATVQKARHERGLGPRDKAPNGFWPELRKCWKEIHPDDDRDENALATVWSRRAEILARPDR
jgi:hypothetical protein